MGWLRNEREVTVFSRDLDITTHLSNNNNYTNKLSYCSAI